MQREARISQQDSSVIFMKSGIFLSILKYIDLFKFTDISKPK